MSRLHSKPGMSRMRRDVQHLRGVCILLLLLLGLAGVCCQGLVIYTGGNYQYFEHRVESVQWSTTQDDVCGAYPDPDCPVDPDNLVFSSLISSWNFATNPTVAACCTAYFIPPPDPTPGPVTSTDYTYGLTCVTVSLCRWESGMT